MLRRELLGNFQRTFRHESLPGIQRIAVEAVEDFVDLRDGFRAGVFNQKCQIVQVPTVTRPGQADAGLAGGRNMEQISPP